MLWNATKPNLPGWLETPATTMPRGSNNAAEVVEGGGVAAPRARDAGRLRARAGGQLHERVDRDGDAAGDDERVDVDGHDRRVLLDQLRQCDECRREGLAVDGGFTAERPQQRLGPERVDHVEGVVGVDRHDPERDVGDGLGEHAADPDHDARPELRVGVHPRDQLARSPDHRRDEQRDLAVVRTRRGEEVDSRGGDRLGRREAQPHEPALRLVRDRVARQLDHDRESELGRGGDRRVGRRHEALGCDRDAGLFDTRLRLELRQRASGVTHAGFRPSCRGRASTRRAGRASAACPPPCVVARRAARTPAGACTARAALRRTRAARRGRSSGRPSVG